VIDRVRHNPDESVHARWARIGIGFEVEPADRTPDLERLLLDTARASEADPNLFSWAVSWLSVYSNFVARHRLKHLVETELDDWHQPILGFLIAEAIEHGAAYELHIASDVCKPAEEKRFLFEIQARLTRGTLRDAFIEQSSPRAEPWHLWAPPVEVRTDALHSARWILDRNPPYRDRIIRKGDLRCTILETLRRDVADHRVRSESELARRCSANRIAVRDALDALEQEGYALRSKQRHNQRDTPIHLGEVISGAGVVQD